MNKEQIQVIYDDRERANELLQQLASNNGVNIVKKRLPLGDYQIGEWLIERKTLADLVQSLCDGRLFSQVYRLAQSPLKAALLIEGSSRDIETYRINREAIIGAICSITVNFDIPILRSLSQVESANILYYCASQMKRRDTKLSLRNRKPKRKKNRQLYLLQGLPQVGPKLAQKLLNHFNDIEAVFTASEEQLIEVEGLGKTRARKIRELLS